MYWPIGPPQVYSSQPDWPKSDDENGLEEAPQPGARVNDHAILHVAVSRNDQFFGTITEHSLEIWQTSPVVALARADRSASSLEAHGTNVAVYIRPDSSIAIVQTSEGYLITYSILIDPAARVFQLNRQDEKGRRYSLAARFPEQQERNGFREVQLRFRMLVKIAAGINSMVALDDELIAATAKSTAVQCIRWTKGEDGSQTTTEVLHRLPWYDSKAHVREIVHNRAMGVFVWLGQDGSASIVQKLDKKSENPPKLFKGYKFHKSSRLESKPWKAAINARFSLIALAMDDGEVLVYTARDYAGSIPFSHRLPAPGSPSSCGAVTNLAYSPDGYCLFVGFEKGWSLWSVYGRPGASSFSLNDHLQHDGREQWLTQSLTANWINNGSELLMTTFNDSRLWVLSMAKHALTGCYTSSNVSRLLIHTTSELLLFPAHNSPSLMSDNEESSRWQRVPIPPAFSIDQKPIRSIVISSDGRYIAVAGRRGFTHYSVTSGRWKTFDDPADENSFLVRGGMCWFQHVLIAATESGDGFELRVISRESSLNTRNLMHCEILESPVVTMSLIGDDSLLVYTQDNTLLHFIVLYTDNRVQLAQVGHIEMHGIVRAPARVRAVTWFVPDFQLLEGEPSQDVVHAKVLFLVDAKLVLLQPMNDNRGSVRYDMRILANNVEFFSFTRDQAMARIPSGRTPLMTPLLATDVSSRHQPLGLHDSLWYFDGAALNCWVDVQDLFQHGLNDASREIISPATMFVDFYPATILLDRGIILGLESHFTKTRDVPFTYFRPSIRTDLFLPSLFRHLLFTFSMPVALTLAYDYQHLSYFSHALEILLHRVLDDEVDKSLADRSKAQLPTIVSFLSSFPPYLDVIVQCARKTEVRSWQTLFQDLPPPHELFEQSLGQGMLKTAGGYLLVLHSFDERTKSSTHGTRLFRKAAEVGDWELCKELARFLMAVDPSGDELRMTIQNFDMANSPATSPSEVTSVASKMAQLSTQDKPNVTSSLLQNGLGIIEDGSDDFRPSGRPGTAIKTEIEVDDYFSKAG